MDDCLLELEHVSLSYQSEVVKDISLKIFEGEILALAGESGSGKTSLLNGILGLPGTGITVTEGKICYAGKNLTAMSQRERNALMGTEITMIFQNSGAAFNPIRSYKKQFAQMLKSHNRFHGKDSYKEIMECFEKLGLPDGEEILNSCPYEMSGGMNQRIAIAAAVLLGPRLLLADEPTSALDVRMQKQAIEELLHMRRLTGCAMILVTHNLGVAAQMADRIGIMFRGEMVECGETKKVLTEPSHPYTKRLIEAVPVLGERI